MESESRLVRMCIESACESRESVGKWRLQRRTLERLPSALADAVLRRLSARRLLFPSLLEVFKRSAEAIDLRGENAVDAEWMAYLGAFRYLRSLNLADCHRVTSSALWALAGMSSLKELDLSRCSKVNDAGVNHIVSISSLEMLRISETGVTAEGVKLVSLLINLSVLDLGGLPVDDAALSSLQVLKNLEFLDLWGSNISNEGVDILQTFPSLSFLNLAWTSVTRLPKLLSIECINMSNCTIDSLLEGDGYKASLAKLVLSGATFANETKAFLHVDTCLLSFLDVSNSSLHGFYFLHHMTSLESLNLCSSIMGDDSIEVIASIGANLRDLNLCKTKVTSAGLASLAGHLPKLEKLLLSHTPIDDSAISYISIMPCLKFVDLSNTAIKGLVHGEGTETKLIPSLAALHGLDCLESLNLEHTKVSDAALEPLSICQELRHLYLQSPSITDVSLHHLSSLSKLKRLSIRDAVLTDCGLESFSPPTTLEMLDVRGCWLLTEDAIFPFSRKHPLIEVRHEHSVASPSNQSGFNCISPSQKSLKTLSLHHKQGKMPMSWPISQGFIGTNTCYLFSCSKVKFTLIPFVYLLLQIKE
uniref:Uncharacterized protein MANES_02G010400 n=1 Tax=Rhizophora mucronata TaxID=61149 RepID=A0A2P2KHE1_RHIMU